MTDEKLPLPDPSNDRFVRVLTAEIGRRMEVQPPFDERSALADLHTRIDTTHGRQQTGQPRPSVGHRLQRNGFLGTRTLRNRTWQIVSASVAAVLLVATSLTMLSRHRNQLASDSVITYATPNGERANIVLPDGTRVTLNVGSRIDIPRRFGEHDRNVRLQGEAYFAVAHTAGAPFTIDVMGARTTVLGTEFGIRAYQPTGTQGTSVQVAVRSGKVSVNNVVLTAHDIAQLSTAGRVFVARKQSVDAALAFTLGRLVIANRPLQDALPDLNRWFGVDIRLGDPSLGAVRLDAVLTSSSVSDLIGVMENTLDVRAVRDGHTVTFYAKEPR